MTRQFSRSNFKHFKQINAVQKGGGGGGELHTSFKKKGDPSILILNRWFIKRVSTKYIIFKIRATDTLQTGQWQVVPLT